ncbi:hypothetical protein B0T25DRAFT_62277 [Lasiosphaeria hispida]|uniref:Uncharacterized protein n=1 Tax=Lasiosphaeria hispida TaxID=260671 RepID=A0AAJ0ML16_9PEZI|nr:hypothetical protein B0T25DRAFT_62277 [Lasiosphaeria hispida]
MGLEEFDPSTGKLATMFAPIHATAVSCITHDCYHVIAKSLESLGQLDKPIGPLALGVELDVCALDKPATLSTAIALHNNAENKIPACLIVFFNGNDEGARKYAQFITEHTEDAHTMVAVQLALPGRVDSKGKQQRLAQKSVISVFTMANGVVKPVLQQEPLSIPGEGIKLWLSGFVKERESLPDEFVRPLYVSRHHPNITIPYTTILASANKKYRFRGHSNASINPTKASAPSSITLGNGKRPLSTLASGPMPAGGKQTLSTHAGRLVANGLLGHGGKRQPLSTFFTALDSCKWTRVQEPRV